MTDILNLSKAYLTKIECSNYNPNIDDEVTVTVSLIDFNGNAVTNTDATITVDRGYFTKYTRNSSDTSISGTSTKSYTGKTGSDGTFVMTYKCSEWGLCTFSTNNSNAQINVEGFRTIRDESTNIIRFDGNTVQIRIIQSSNSGLPKTYSYPTIPSSYRATYSISSPLASIGDNGEVYGYIRTQSDGSLNLILSKQTYNASTGGMTLYGTLEYTI